MLSVIVSGNCIYAADLTYSNVDPGGFEAASFTVTQPPFSIKVGDQVLITEGIQVAWHGLVEEPGKHIENGVITYAVNAVGYGSELKRNPFSFIFVDSDLTKWTGTSIFQRIRQVTSNFQINDLSTGVDSATGLPSMIMSIQGAWASPYKPLVEGFWDAGYGNNILRAFIDWKANSVITSISGGVSWNLAFYLVNDDKFTSFDTSSQTGASGTASLVASTNDKRYVGVQLFYNTTPAGTDGASWEAFAYNQSVFGNHSLPIRTYTSAIGLTIRGLAVSDIVSEINKRSVVFNPVIKSNNLIVTRASYPEPTDANTMLEDQRKLTGWHWGVWEPVSILDDQPSLWFTPPVASPTVSILMEQLDDLDVTESYSALYDTIIVKYTDPGGVSASYTYTNPNIRISKSNTLYVDMGSGTVDTASVFARYVLTLNQLGVRATGSCQLPATLGNGISSHMVKAGRDKIKIIDYPPSVQRIVDFPIDTFHISRVTVSVNNGTPTTQIEFDQGADLIEVLQARLEQGNAQVGF